jgi:sec-independent protein translocase protein TatB
MFGVDTTELLIVALAALVFIGPKELPTAMRTVGRWVGRARAHARHFTSGIENMMREAELEEMEKRWREENERIMREHPVAVPYAGAADTLGAPVSEPPPVAEESRQPPEPTFDDEPGLPLPDPEHSKRELP